jgi:hypothetical protein
LAATATTSASPIAAAFALSYSALCGSCTARNTLIVLSRRRLAATATATPTSSHYFC